MFREGVTATLLLYVTRAMVYCDENKTEASEEFLVSCDFRDSEILERRHRCDFQTLNYTFTVMSYRSIENKSDIFCCCSPCAEDLYESEVDSRNTARQQEYLNFEEKSNGTRFCSVRCYADGQTIRIWVKWNYDGIANDRINHSFPWNWTRTPGDEDKGDGEGKEKTWCCDSIFSSLNFWGAHIVVFANIIYIVPYVIVVLVYYVCLGSSRRAYDKAVICYNVSQIVLNGVIIGIGGCVLCHVSIPPNVYVYLGLTIMFLTISSTCWLFVICIDMTLVITRFRWTGSVNTNQRQYEEEENQKFFTYARWTWGGSLLPTLITGIIELSPLLPQSSPAKPHFSRFNDTNLAVILYVTPVPASILLANTILFCYTSYKMLLIQKSTAVATANSTSNVNTVKARYFIFLKLYLLMDAPWITNALAAAFTDLWLLKFLRMIQPILMLIAILPPGTISRAFRSAS